MKFRLFSNVHWSDKLVDVLVVVLGITIAFWLSNWQETRKNKASEQKYLAALQTDLAKDTVQLLTITEDMDTILFGISRIHRLADNPENADSIYRYLGLLDRDQIFFFPEDYTYKALQQNGDIGLIQNDSLLLVLSHLYDDYENLNLFNELAYEWLLRNFQPYFNNFDPRNRQVINSELFIDPVFFIDLMRYSLNVQKRQEIINGTLEKHRTLQRFIRKELHE